MPFFSFFKQKTSKGKDDALRKKDLGLLKVKDRKLKGEKQKASAEVTKEKEHEKKEKKTISPFLSHHTTEKTTELSERGVYTFKVDPSFNKIMARKEIKKVYGVDPVKVNIVKSPSKRKFIRGRWGKSGGFKKALVYLKEGEKLQL